MPFSEKTTESVIHKHHWKGNPKSRGSKAKLCPNCLADLWLTEWSLGTTENSTDFDYALFCKLFDDEKYMAQNILGHWHEGTEVLAMKTGWFCSTESLWRTFRKGAIHSSTVLNVVGILHVLDQVQWTISWIILLAISMLHAISAWLDV